MAAEVCERKSAIVERRGKVLLERGRPVEARERFVEAPQVAQRIAQIVVRVRDVVVEPDGSPDQVNAALAAAGLRGNQAQQMQRIEVAWLLSENVLVDLLCRRQLPPLMQRKSLREHGLRRGRIGFLGVTCFGHPTSSRASKNCNTNRIAIYQHGYRRIAAKAGEWP
ncbi:hypothetical protein [Bradyrhizobium sp. CER78]|uniref:hypothetical protein n=1 Tax=Bradyrhizobium sp. CER78 TaxID=3039162 RepID=UPI00244A6871|nr:hypothetical protein [Bradyrhizobium sp. CER78]MDH2383214.1 hypothetical protein [Bradyrhizobium sp. CER78]